MCLKHYLVWYNHKEITRLLMKLKNSYFYTLRENVKDEDSISGNFLVRAGLVKKSSSGVYMYLPLGLKVLNKIEAIIRDEMEQIGSQEVLMPSLIPEDVYIQSGRRESFGSSMFTLKDRFLKPFVLGPTHEELFAAAANAHIQSYKDMPISLFQFQNKFRDEPRPRFGLIRVREFIMKDAYSFDTDLEGLDKSYQAMFNAYKRIFDRLSINYKIVTADTGVMGGLLSEEFQALSSIGEDVLVTCDHCGFASNLEVAACVASEHKSTGIAKKASVVDTPNARTIEEVAAFLNQDATQFVKTLIYLVDKKPVALCLRGDHEVNETKVMKLLNANAIELAPLEVVVEVSKAPIGFAGPIGLEIDVIVDQEVLNLTNFIVGANQKDKHIQDVNITDFKISLSGDIRQIKEGDACPSCFHPVVFQKGIEVGNTFKLGEKYAKAMDLFYSDDQNQLKPVIMGSYGIGLGRCMAAVVEQHHDDAGIIWPMAIAPFEVVIVLLNDKDELQVQTAHQLYQACKQANIDVLLDDRSERAGVKFNDMDLLGIPLRVVLGKALVNQQVELKVRDQAEKQLVAVDQIVDTLLKMIQKQR